jgi:MoaA/NifB/PqqE/SkfB family radical SAM enzyme
MGESPGSVSDLLAAGTSRVLFELTSRCNLKCVYCAVSQPDYHGQDLEVEHEQIVAQTAALHPSEVQISGHGETTLVRGWHLLAREFLRRGLPLSLTTNLSKRLSFDELQVLCEFSRITVSCDTTDPELFAKLRRGSRLDAVQRNLKSIVDTSRSRKRQKPYIALNCTVMQETIGGLVELVRWAARHGVSCVSLTNLVRYPALRGVMVPTHPADVDPSGALEKLEDARRAASTAGLDFNIMGGLEAELHSASNRASSRPVPAEPGETRDCVDPWEMAFIRADGQVALCCWSKHLGNLKTESLDELIDSPAARKMREGLLTGDLGEDCRRCPARGTTRRELLARKVRRTLHRRGLGDLEKLRSRVHHLESEREQLLRHAETLEVEQRHMRNHIAIIEPERFGLLGHVKNLEQEREHLTGHIQNLERERRSIAGFVARRMRARLRDSFVGKFWIRVRRRWR